MTGSRPRWPACRASWPGAWSVRWWGLRPRCSSRVRRRSEPSSPAYWDWLGASPHVVPVIVIEKAGPFGPFSDRCRSCERAGRSFVEPGDWILGLYRGDRRRRLAARGLCRQRRCDCDWDRHHGFSRDWSGHHLGRAVHDLVGALYVYAAEGRILRFRRHRAPGGVRTTEYRQRRIRRERWLPVTAGRRSMFNSPV